MRTATGRQPNRGCDDATRHRRSPVCLRPAARDPCRVGLAGWKPGKGQRGWPQVEVEQAIAQARLVVVVTLGLRGRHDLDLARVQPEAFIDRADLRLGGLRVRQKNPTGAAFDHRRGNARILDVGQRLRGEDDADVLLPQCFEPLADAGGEHRVIEEQPGFIEDQQRGRAVEALIEAGEQVPQHGQHRRLAVHQLFHLEALHTAETQAVRISVQQLAVGTAQHIGRECLAQCVRLQQHRQARQRALLCWHAGEAAECRPDRGLLVRADGDTFMQQAAFHPFGGPGAVALLVDASQWLEGNRPVVAQVVMLAAEP